jgi:Glutamate-cysteine ligase
VRKTLIHNPTSFFIGRKNGMESTTHTPENLLSAAYLKRYVSLLPIVERNMDAINTESDVKEKTHCYLAWIRERANAKSWTPSGWTRDFVHFRPEYTMNSVVSERLCHDLLRKTSQLATTSTAEESFHRTTQIPP